MEIICIFKKKLVLQNKTFKLAEMTQGVAISKVVG